MQDIRWRAFWLIVSLTFVCLIVWAASDSETALISFSVGITLYLFGHLHWLNQLIKWYRKRDLATMPLGGGIWEDLFAAVYHEQRRHIRSQTQLSSALDRFRHAASALPDGIVLLSLIHI